MKSEEFVLVPVPKSRVLEVYRLLGGDAAPVEPEAFEAIVTQAYEDSEEGMKAFLELLAAHPDEWLGIQDIREELGMDVHVLPGVLSSFPRRWRNRYHQSGPLPYDQDRKAGQSQYRMRKKVAELITSLG
jgi:hypothetical protein